MRFKLARVLLNLSRHILNNRHRLYIQDITSVPAFLQTDVESNGFMRAPGSAPALARAPRDLRMYQLSVSQLSAHKNSQRAFKQQAL